MSGSLARKFLEENITLETVEFNRYEKDFEYYTTLINLLYYSLDYYGQKYYGKPDFNTVEFGVVVLEKKNGLVRAVGASMSHRYKSTVYNWVGPQQCWFSISVHEDYRRDGLAKKLSKQLFSLLSKNSIPTVYASVDVNNKASQALMKSLGLKHFKTEKFPSETLFFKKDLTVFEEYKPTKDNIRRFKKVDGTLYSGPLSILVDKVKSYDNSNDLVIYGRIGDYPIDFKGAKIISTNIAKTPQTQAYLREFSMHPNGLQLQVSGELKKQDKYNYLRATLRI